MIIGILESVWEPWGSLLLYSSNVMCSGAYTVVVSLLIPAPLQRCHYQSLESWSSSSRNISRRASYQINQNVSIARHQMSLWYLGEKEIPPFYAFLRHNSDICLHDRCFLLQWQLFYAFLWLPVAIALLHDCCNPEFSLSCWGRIYDTPWIWRTWCS